MKCPRCESEEFRKHVKRKNKDEDEDEKIQRFKCKKCGKTFSKHKVTYTKAEKRLLSFLLNFLENDLGNLDIKDFLRKSKEYRSDTSNIVIKECKRTKTTEIKSDWTIFNASCKKPRLVICEDEGKITLVKVPKEDADKHKQYFQLSFQLNLKN